ncbi:hypothetical protein CDAR_618071 [Caerostris darwini]|uniref:Uncharacterized protein n=1 Tax=Caerostris darwini TaxID=1538125 RepID=A0AAV4U8U1_9ARAC|nr:hypothetical protein CDAR_618071 [Caerostris darwini]
MPENINLTLRNYRSFRSYFEKNLGSLLPKIIPSFKPKHGSPHYLLSMCGNNTKNKAANQADTGATCSKQSTKYLSKIVKFRSSPSYQIRPAA